jgi:hypothetical protein
MAEAGITGTLRLELRRAPDGRGETHLLRSYYYFPFKKMIRALCLLYVFSVRVITGRFG